MLSKLPGMVIMKRPISRERLTNTHAQSCYDASSQVNDLERVLLKNHASLRSSDLKGWDLVAWPDHLMQLPLGQLHSLNHRCQQVSTAGDNPSPAPSSPHMPGQSYQYLRCASPLLQTLSVWPGCAQRQQPRQPSRGFVPLCKDLQQQNMDVCHLGLHETSTLLPGRGERIMPSKGSTACMVRLLQRLHGRVICLPAHKI